jgi:hypothetical protein
VGWAGNLIAYRSTEASLRRVAMIDSRIITALRIIYDKLTQRDIRWVLVGSTSLALQGVNVTPRDIDFLTDKDGAYKINELLKDHKVRPVEYRQSERLRSYLGEFRISNVKVEVMGNYEEKVKREWQSLESRLASPTIIQFVGMRLPVSPLRAQLLSYQSSGLEKDRAKVKEIRKVLEKSEGSRIGFEPPENLG